MTNVMGYIAAIESKAIEVIGSMIDADDSEAGSQGSPSHTRNSVFAETDERKARVMLPSTEDFCQEVIEDRPLTIQELQSSFHNVG
jgi:hypothetical protein